MSVAFVAFVVTVVFEILAISLGLNDPIQDDGIISIFSKLKVEEKLNICQLYGFHSLMES